MYPKNIANAILTPAEAAELAERHMQMAPHPSFVPRRAVMHQPQAVIPRLPHGYMHTASASNPASTQAEQLAAAAKTARNVQSKLEENAAHALQAAQAAAEAAERAAQQTAAEASEWASRQAAAEAAERASRQAVLKEAEKSAKQTAVEIAKRIAQQAAVETAERIAQQAAVETAERIAQQAAVETAERITRQAAAEETNREARLAAVKTAEREARLAAVETAERVAQQTAAEAAKRAAVETVERKARQVAVETVRRVVRQAANKAAERNARYATLKEAAQVAEQAAVEAAEQAAQQATVEAEEQAAQQAAVKAEEQAARQAVVASAQRVVQQTANKAAERAARFAALKEAAQVARQAAVDAVAQAARQAAVDAAEQAARQAAVAAAEQAVRQAAVDAAEQAARQAAGDAAQAARQAAVEAAQIDEAAAQTMSSEPSAQVTEAQEQIVEAVTQAVPQKIAKQAAQALQAELPPASAQAVVKTLEEKSALAQKRHIHKQSTAPVEESASQTVPAAAKSAPQMAPVAENGSEPQTALATAAPVAVSPVSAAGIFGIPATLHFCTVAGSSYLFKVATLYRSLEAYSDDFMLYVCCIDDETLAAMEKLHLPRCIAVSVDALGDSGLAALRSQRSASEFCWTLKSHLLLWLLTEKRLPEAVYLDSDVAFFSDPKQLYDDWGNASVYLCRQRDLDWVEQKYGKYQAGVIGFKNDEQGVAAVRWWRDKCRAWCFAAPDTGQYGDQKYLDDIPALFRSVRISTHRGIDAAPWNTVYNNNYPISVSGNEIRIDGDPLVAYHFACLDVIDEQHFDLWNLSGISIGQTISNAIYVPYLAKLRESISEVHAKTGGRYYARKTFGDARTPYIYSDNNLSISHWDGMYGFCTIASKQYAARTLALYNSLENHAGNFHIWICCMDVTAYAILSAFNLGNATLVKVSDVETEEAKATRTSKKLYEYCWTMKPLLCQHVFQNYNISRLIYCDADIYFFASPQAIHNEWRRYETYLNLQRGSAQLEAVHGMYQAGLIGFSKAAESLRTLNWWAQQCTAWCYDNHDDHSRWGDQKYLTQMPNLFASIKVNNRYGLLAAPWNIVMNNSKDLPVHTDEGGTVWIGDEALTCFHFGSINVLSESEYDLWKLEPLNFDPAIIESIYKPYLAHLRSIYGEIRGKGFDTSGLFESGAGAQNPFTLEG